MTLNFLLYRNASLALARQAIPWLSEMNTCCIIRHAIISFFNVKCNPLPGLDFLTAPGDVVVVPFSVL